MQSGHDVDRQGTGGCWLAGQAATDLLPPTTPRYGRHSKSLPAVLPQATITALKKEIENSWRMVDSSHEKAGCLGCDGLPRMCRRCR